MANQDIEVHAQPKAAQQPAVLGCRARSDEPFKYDAVVTVIAKLLALVWVPKAKIDAMMAKEKTGKRKHK